MFSVVVDVVVSVVFDGVFSVVVDDDTFCISFL